MIIFLATLCCDKLMESDLELSSILKTYNLHTPWWDRKGVKVETAKENLQISIQIPQPYLVKNYLLSKWTCCWGLHDAVFIENFNFYALIFHFHTYIPYKKKHIKWINTCVEVSMLGVHDVMSNNNVCCSCLVQL